MHKNLYNGSFMESRAWISRSFMELVIPFAGREPYHGIRQQAVWLKQLPRHKEMTLKHFYAIPTRYMVVDQYSFILEWPFIAEKKISFADLSRPHREAWSYNHV